MIIREIRVVMEIVLYLDVSMSISWLKSTIVWKTLTWREPISCILQGFFCFIFRHLQIFDKGILPFVKLFGKVSPYQSSYLLLLDSHFDGSRITLSERQKKQVR